MFENQSEVLSVDDSFFRSTIFYTGIMLLVAVGIGYFLGRHSVLSSTQNDPEEEIVITLDRDSVLADSSFQDLVDLVCKEEGFRPHPYEDTHNSIAIGCGTNLTFRGITMDQARYLAQDDLFDIMNELSQKWPAYFNENVEVQLGLVDAAYELGVEGLLDFHSTLEAIGDCNTQKAIEEIIDSRWFRNPATNPRAQRLINIVKEHLC